MALDGCPRSEEIGKHDSLQNVLDAESDEEYARIGETLQPVRVSSAHPEARFILIRFAEERDDRHGFLLLSCHVSITAAATRLATTAVLDNNPTTDVDTLILFYSSTK